MLVLAVTGGLGAGKSTAVRYFAGCGAVVIALDEVARDVLARDAATRASVVEAFGGQVVAPDGAIDRDALARAAFATPEAAERLNAIVHPAALDATFRLLGELAASAEPPALVVLEVPLLAEAPTLAEAVDVVLSIAAPVEARVARAVARGMAEYDARHRIACQAGDADRARIADAVIENAGDESAFAEELARFFGERIAPRLEGGR